jgi:hypothetical protein
LSLVGVASA